MSKMKIGYCLRLINEVMLWKINNYSWLSGREHGYIGFGIHVSSAAFTLTKPKNTKLCFYLYVDLLSSVKVNFFYFFLFFVGAGQAEPGFRSSILLSKLLWYAFPAIRLVFDINPKQIGRRAGILQNLRESTNQKFEQILKIQNFVKKIQNGRLD